MTLPPVVPPQASFVYEAIVDIGPTQMLGEGPLGERRLVPILGGCFEGPRIRGTVLAGGADRQLIRRDGIKRLEAQYEMQAEDGAVLTVFNRVLIDGDAYRFSHIDIAAPDGRHAWLNRLLLVGTLNPLRPARDAVLIRAFSLG